ncbi:MAG: HAMP domain-containing sensor histidine kinase [Candidatus Woykebacteria bacterium]
MRVKFSLAAVLIFLVIFSITSFVLIRQNIDSQKNSLLARANTFAGLATKPIGDDYTLYFESGYYKFRESLQDIFALNEDITRAQIISVDGEVFFDTFYLDLAESPSPKKIDEPRLLIAVRSNSLTGIADQGGSITQIIVPYNDDFGARPFSIRYFISYESVYENINSTILTTLLLSVLVLILAVLAISALVNFSILSPLGKVVAAAKKISEGDVNTEIKLSTGDELEDIASSLDQMTVTLRKNIEDLKALDKLKNEFVFLASHNLRTPLTVVKGYVDNLKNADLGKKAAADLEKISESTRELESMVESLINLVSLEKEKQLTIKNEVDLKDLIRQITLDAKSKLNEKRLSLVFETPEEKLPKVSVDQKRIRQAFENLIDNAIKFNKENGKIVIGLRKKGDSVVISIADTGIGISEGEKARVFQKFHRATDVLTYNYEGIGLGLYLAKLIIEAHQGKIWFDSTIGKGTTFYVQLPIKAKVQGG